MGFEHQECETFVIRKPQQHYQKEPEKQNTWQMKLWRRVLKWGGREYISQWLSKNKHI